MHAVILIGCPGAGKSTFYRQQFFETHLRINLDMLRTRHREGILLRACLEMKQPFVVDNTNPLRADRQRYIQAALAARFTVTGYYFDSDLEALLRRNRERSGKGRVPDAAVRRIHLRLEPPAIEEGFTELWTVRVVGGGRFEISALDERSR